MAITRQDIKNHLQEKVYQASERLASITVDVLEFIRIKMLKGKK